jgi:hypothetical protein
MTLKKGLTIISLILIIPAAADTVGHWRFDSDEAEVETPITSSENVANARCSTPRWQPTLFK